MLEQIQKRVEENKSSVKIEERPKDTYTLTELIEESGLSPTECGCVVNQLVSDGTVETVGYTTGVSACGDAIRSTVYRVKALKTKEK